MCFSWLYTTCHSEPSQKTTTSLQQERPNCSGTIRVRDENVVDISNTCNLTWPETKHHQKKATTTRQAMPVKASDWSFQTAYLRFVVLLLLRCLFLHQLTTPVCVSAPPSPQLQWETITERPQVYGGRWQSSQSSLCCKEDRSPRVRTDTPSP